MSERDLAGRVVVITGANIGIGLASATALATRGARLRLLGRSPEKHAPVLQELRRLAGHDDVHFVRMDLGRLASVAAAADELLARGEPIHLLINNAGLAGQRGLTADGFELAFGTNHLGHFLLTERLLPRLRESAPARIVAVASDSHRKARGIDWQGLRQPTRSVTGMPEYEVSKLCNVLHMNELARRLGDAKVTTASLNPGRIASNIWQRMPFPFRQLFKLTMWSTAQGARSTLHAALSEEGGRETGAYYDKHCRRLPPNPLALDPTLASELWRRSEAWVTETLAKGAAA